MLAIGGSMLGATLASIAGLRIMLVVACLSASASQLCLLTGHLHIGTALLGFGFGLGAAPLNAYPSRLFPGSPSAALVALHAVMGLGLSLGPIFVGGLIARDAWSTYPSFTLALGVVAALAAAR
ncbi:MAG: hypothetical protein HC923_08970, partial [Myxococcales bacterium]|nr:hypothetical protein [Myxococcales bacterium]